VAASFDDAKIARRGAGLSGAAGPLWFALGLAGAIAIFWSGLVSLVEAWSIPEYSHGPIIPLISTFLFLREMRHVPPTNQPVTDRWAGVIVVIVALVIGLLGVVARIPQIVTYGFIVWIAGMILTSFGLRRGVMFWPAVVHLAFMLPLPQFIYWQVSTYLQIVSSEIGVAVIALMGIPVYLEGNIIDLGVYKLQVAEACSGLRYLFPMLSFSFVFAVLYQGPRWHKLALLLSAAPITVLMNSFRIGVIGVLVDNYGIAQAEGFLHSFEGWVIFIACVAILFLIATVLQRLTRHPKPLSETLDIEFDGLGAQLRRIGDVAPSAAMIVGALMTVGVATAWRATPEREVVRASRDPLAIFPLAISDWRGRLGAPLDTEIERVLAADDYFSAAYAAPGEARPVDLFIAYYYNQMDGAGIHSPEICIPAGGWEVSGWERSAITLPSGESVDLVQAVIQKGQARQLVYFWFDLRGKRISGSYEAKFANLIDSAAIGRSDGALVRVITPIAPNEDIAAAADRLQRFMVSSLETLPRFIPH